MSKTKTVKLRQGRSAVAGTMNVPHTWYTVVVADDNTTGSWAPGVYLFITCDGADEYMSYPPDDYYFVASALTPTLWLNRENAEHQRDEIARKLPPGVKIEIATVRLV